MKNAEWAVVDSHLAFENFVRSITVGLLDGTYIQAGTLDPLDTLGYMGRLYVRGIDDEYFINGSALEVWEIGRLRFRGQSWGTGTIAYNSVRRVRNVPLGVTMIAV